MKVVRTALAMFSLPVQISASVVTLFRTFSLLTGLLLLPALSPGQVFVQENNNTVAANAASVSVTYATAETPGNLNVVVVGWDDTTSSVLSVADDNTNTYVLAGTSAGNGISQAIYYAANIVLPNNNTPTVTVTFNQTAGFPDVRILEYSGLSATTPLDNWAGNSGASVSADSGGITTSTSSLILGAGTTSTHFTAAGAGFTSRTITSPFGDIVEDSDLAQPAGTYNATADLTDGRWVMQVAAFSTTGVSYPNAPVIDAITPISPASGPDIGGTVVTITGTNFQPGAVVLFGSAPGGLSGLNCTESGGTTITCLTPVHSVGLKDITVVNVDGQLGSAAAAYDYLSVAPAISAVTPNSGPTNGRAVTITGNNFQGGAKVTIGGLPASDVVVQDSATITVNTPGLPVGSANVTVKNPDGGTVTSPGAFTYALGSGPINYIQRGGAAPNLAATVPVSMPNPQAAGNLNIVIIGWTDTVATVSSVTDTEGNTYVAALPTVTGTGLSQVIYYAKNIVGDGGTPNVITVTFSQGAQFPDVRILEYSGLDTTSPLGSVAGNAGLGSLADTGACTTTSAVELIVAGGTVESLMAGAGSGFNLLDLTQPNGDVAEHQITSAIGSCQATAPLVSASNWVMQAVTFKPVPVPTPDFSLSATPSSQTVVAGGPASYTISVTGVAGFNSAVALTCSAITLPAGASCDFVPNPVTPGVSAATSALTISTTAATPAGTSSVTVTGTSGLLSHDTSVNLTVNPPPDFTIAASALSPATVTAGTAATSTITITPLHGFNGAVNLTCSSITPVVSPAPTCAFVPSTVPGGSGTSTLTVSSSATTPPGPFSVTVTGTSGSLTHDATPLSLTINAPPPADFTIAASALSPATVTAGTPATSTVTIAPLNGFIGAVTLTCSSITPIVSPAPTCAFVPNSVPGGSGTSILTVNSSATTPPGPFSVTVTGTSGSLTHNANSLSLTINAPPPADFTLTASPLTPATVSAGGTATSTITIAPQNGFNGAVSLACSVAPVVARGPACSFNPTSVAGGSGTSTLTVTTTAATTASLVPHSPGVSFAMWLPIGGLALLGAGFTSRRKKFLSFLFGCLLFTGLIFMSACGGGSTNPGGGGHPGTPAGTYTITVAGTAGSLAHPQTVTLTVN